MRLTRILAFAAALAVASIPASAYIIHKVKRGDSLFGIANKYHVSPDDIVALNPQAKNGLAKVKELKIPENGETVVQQPDTPTTQPSDSGRRLNQSSAYNTYIATDDDKNMVQVAKKLNRDVHELIDLNPFVDPDALVAGTAIRLTEDASVISPTPGVAVNTPEVVETPEATVVSIPAEDPLVVVSDEDTEVKVVDNEKDTDDSDSYEQTIMIAQPFMADGNQPRHAQLVTDFYKGFLLAVNNERGITRYPVRIIAEDTENSAGVLLSRLGEYRYDGISMIIPPEETAQFEAAADYATRNETFVLNVQNIKDDSYLTNPYMIQCNVPLNMMYDKVADMLLSDFEGYTLVILEPQGGKTEKQAFVDIVHGRYEEAGVDVIELPFGENLTLKELEILDKEGRYVFLPKSGSVGVFNKIAGGIGEFQDTVEDPANVQLIGYPDWITFRGDNMRALNALGATYFSRVAYYEDNEDVQEIERDYENWYSAPMINAVPNQGLLGYDTASMLMHALTRETLDELGDYDGFRYDGLQSAYRFVRIPDGGLVNSAVYIITCNADGTITTRVI